MRKVRCWDLFRSGGAKVEMWAVSVSEIICSVSSWVVRVSESMPSEGEGIQGVVRTARAGAD